MCNVAHHRSTIAENSVYNYTLFYSWITPILKYGFHNNLTVTDLPALPRYLSSAVTKSLFDKFRSKRDRNIAYDSGKLCVKANILGYKLLFKLLKVYYQQFCLLGFIKLFQYIPFFIGPLLLGKLVDFIGSHPSTEELLYGCILSISMFICYGLSALISSQYSFQAALLQKSIRSSLTNALFSKSIELPLYILPHLALSDAKLCTLVQVDVQKVDDAAATVHDVWTLPLMICVACALLYMKVRISIVSISIFSNNLNSSKQSIWILDSKYILTLICCCVFIFKMFRLDDEYYYFT